MANRSALIGNGKVTGLCVVVVGNVAVVVLLIVVFDPVVEIVLVVLCSLELDRVTVLYVIEAP